MSPVEQPNLVVVSALVPLLGFQGLISFLPSKIEMFEMFLMK
jgi:hypothetical protein